MTGFSNGATQAEERGVPIDAYTEQEMDAYLQSEETGKIFIYMGTTGKYTHGRIYMSVDD